MKTIQMILGLAGVAGLSLGLSGCLVAGYSSSGGGFIWPGGLGLVVMLLVIWFIFGRRR